jgi:hypothetical protein
VYPDFDEMAQYTGYLKPGNLEIFQDMLKRSGMADQARDFLMASGRFQALLYKEEIESALRTPGMAGFQLLDLHDFPGPGTAVVGVVNAFWNDKGYITAGQYRRFCSQTVPLARMKRLIVTHDRDFEAEIELAHYGSRNLKGAKAAWRITDSVNAVIAKGSFGPMDVPTGSVTSMGRVTLSLTRFVRAAQLNLEVAVEGTDFVNDWDFWVYPAKVDAAIPATMTLTKELNERTGDVLNRGGTVLLVPPRNRLAGKTTGTFRPIFWNRVMFSSQKEHTVGILCDPNHPMFADFPTGVHSDWQWWDLQQNCRPMVLDALPADVRPVVQMIDDWSQCRKLGLVLEARVNKGRLVVCSVDIETDLDRRPVARQFRKSLFDYMAGEQFRPSARLETAQLQTLFREPSLMEKLGAGIIHADSAAPGHEADKIIDGDPQTIWHTPWGSGAAGFPHEVVIGFDESVVLTGLLVTPRQDMSNGWIKDYAVYAGSSNRDWGDPVVRGSFAADAAVKEVNFPNAVTCRYLRLVAISSFRDAPYASLAEIELKTGPGSGLPQP